MGRRERKAQHRWDACAGALAVAITGVVEEDGPGEERRGRVVVAHQQRSPKK